MAENKIRVETLCNGEVWVIVEDVDFKANFLKAFA